MDEQQLSLILESLRNDVAQVGKSLQKIAETVIEEGISEYPVFVASQEFIDLGRPIFELDEFQLNWYFTISILEDFLKRNIVQGERLKGFKKTYGDPRERACIFVVTPEDARFVFVPYDVDAEEKPSMGKNGNG